jgi:hypothetical protein
VLANFLIQVNIAEQEKDTMKVIWNAQLKVQKVRRSRKNKMAAPMVISQAHSSRLALWYSDFLFNVYFIDSVAAVLLHKIVHYSLSPMLMIQVMTLMMSTLRITHIPLNQTMVTTTQMLSRMRRPC